MAQDTKLRNLSVFSCCICLLLLFMLCAGLLTAPNNSETSVAIWGYKNTDKKSERKWIVNVINFETIINNPCNVLNLYTCSLSYVNCFIYYHIKYSVCMTSTALHILEVRILFCSRKATSVMQHFIG